MGPEQGSAGRFKVWGKQTLYPLRWIQSQSLRRALESLDLSLSVAMPAHVRSVAMPAHVHSVAMSAHVQYACFDFAARAQSQDA